MSNQPIVNGVRPLFGPYETEVEIRGSNLGYAKEDLLSVRLCGVECIAHAKWLSQTRIKCRNLVVTAEEVTGEIIVTTNSGGEGKCDVRYILNLTFLSSFFLLELNAFTVNKMSVRKLY